MRSAKFAWMLIAHVFMSVLSFNVFSETTYCFGEVCSENLAEPEAQMKSQYPGIGEKLVFKKTMDQPTYQTRHYHVEDEVSKYVRTREIGSLPDYGSWGSAQCPKGMDVVDSGYIFQNWASTDRGQMSAVHQKRLGVSGSYGIYDEFLKKCTTKTYSNTHYFYRYDDYQCSAGFTINYGGSSSANVPVCTSDLTSFLMVYNCYYPFTFSNKENQCITYCPPQKPNFDKNYGECRPSADQLNIPQCAEKVLNPINTANGAKEQIFNPDFIGSGTFPIQLERFYSSGSSPNHNLAMGTINSAWRKFIQPLGYKGPTAGYITDWKENYWNARRHWFHNYEARVFARADGEVTVEIGFNIKRRFSLSGSLYDADGEIGDKLLKIETGWMYIDTNARRYLFNNEGMNTEIQDISGERQNLYYLPNGNIDKIEHSAGYYIKFYYDDKLRITTIAASDGSIYRYEYDQFSNLSKIIFPDNTTELYHYENQQFQSALTGVTDRRGVRYATWGYDSIGRAVSSQHADGAGAGSVDYGTNGTVVTVKNTQGHDKIITFSNGKLLSVTGESCDSFDTNGKVTYQYNYFGQLAAKKDEAGKVTRYVYDSLGQVSSISEETSDGRQETTSFTYAASLPLVNKITHPNGLEEVFERNNLGKIVKHAFKADGKERVTRYLYNEQGYVSAIKHPSLTEELTTNISYNTRNLVSSITNPLGHTIEFLEYDSLGRALKVKDENGTLGQLTYDISGRVTSYSSAGRTISYVYDAVGNLIQSTSGSMVLSYQYDNARRLISVSDEDDNKIAFTLDASGNVTEENVKRLDVIKYKRSFLYDKINRLSRVTQESGAVWSHQYDISGNITKTIDPNMSYSASQFDKFNRQIQSEDQLQNLTNIQYNAGGQIAAVTDAIGRVTSYKYNGFGEIIQQQSPDSGLTKFEYDVAGNVSKRTDARGIVTLYSYDALNRLVSQQYTDTSQNISYSYDSETPGHFGIGRLQQVQDSSGSTAYRYNSFGQVTQVTQIIQGVTYTFNYMYNADGQLLTTEYPSGVKIKYDYHSNGMASGIRIINGTEQQVVVKDVTYLPFGPVESLQFGNGQTLQRRFDMDYRLIGQQTSDLSVRSYQYDMLNNITAINNSLADNESYQYDLVSRLTQTESTSELQSFNYDAIGNRLSHTSNNTTVPYVYNNGVLSQVGAKLQLYDAVGNIIINGEQQFTYNAAGRLTQAMNPTGTSNYLYNFLGQRVAKATAGTVTHYHYDQQGLLIAESNAAGVLTKAYIYLGRQLVGYSQNNQLYYVHNDHLGRPEALTDQSKTIVWQARLAAFDRLVLSSSIGDFNIGFPGQYWDAEKGSWYNYFRDYDAMTGRYLQSDPLGLFDGPNTYTYVYNNPTNYTDPTGEFGVPGALIGGGIDLFLQLSQNGWNLSCVNPWRLAEAATLGAITGGLGSAAGKQGITAGLKGLSNGTKGTIGKTLSIGKHTLYGSRFLGTERRIPGQRSIADSVWQGRNGSIYYVESKFGTSGLTKAQRAAQKALGEAYKVDRWTYPWFGNLGSGLGGMAGAVGGAAGGAAAHTADRCGCN